MDIERLTQMIVEDAALRRRQILQPVGGKGDKIFPPTYPGEGRNAPPRHVYERRRLNGHESWCVLVDSVQSQANRLEECLLDAARDGVPIPHVVVDFSEAGLEGITRITSLEAPHRVYDAILRDSLLDGEPFMKSEVGTRLAKAKPEDPYDITVHAIPPMISGGPLETACVLHVNGLRRRQPHGPVGPTHTPLGAMVGSPNRRSRSMPPANAFLEIALTLLAASVVGALGTWLRQPLIVSFIAVGVLVGPAGISPITRREEVELLASIGISLLLFVVGLKLDFQTIRTLGPVALATGIGQIVFTSVIGFLIAIALGMDALTAT